jgi:glyoxylase-like metal-dependent hydrolase (beta-lactamase superfamily II)
MQRSVAMASVRPEVTGFYEARTNSIQYGVTDPDTRGCAIVDPVLDYDEKSGSIATRSADAILDFVDAHGLKIAWILDTHPHADHLSAAGYLRDKTGAPTATGSQVVAVQRLWKAIYNLPEDFPTDGSQWDRLFDDGDCFRIGALDVRVMHSPGHTLCSVTYVAGDAAFIHDTLFMPDSGTARADFPGGDAARLWRSIQAILNLPDATRLFTGHDYQPGGRPLNFESTVARQKSENAHLQVAGEAAFVDLRTSRDRILPMPKLILHALQVNIRGGRLPPADESGKVFLKIPIGSLEQPAWDQAN